MAHERQEREHEHEYDRSRERQEAHVHRAEHEPEHGVRQNVSSMRERVESPGYPHEERWTMAGPIHPIGEVERIDDLELNAQATVADAAPLGLAAFAASLFTVSSVIAGWAPLSGLLNAIPILIVFGGIGQFVAAMWAFRKGDTFWATFLGVFGAFFGVVGVGLMAVGATAFPFGTVVQSVSLGITVAMFALIALYLTYAATGVSSVMVWCTGLLTVSLALIAVTFFTGGGTLVAMAAGYAGLVSALLAFYGSAAIVINSALRREALPY